jgi:FkbM family methyltransferase
VAITLRATGRRRAVRVRMQRRGGDDQVARAVGAGGIWGFEPPLPPLFVELARRSSGAVLDVGANTGLYSLLALASNRALLVHAVEPLPIVASYLKENLALNRRLGHRVTVHPVALSDVEGRAMLYLPPPTGTTVETSASLDPHFKEEIASAVEVETGTLDDLWDGIGRPAVGLLKVDTEGTEHLVLRGAPRLLAASRPIAVCEVLPGAAMGELTELLTQSGYLDVRMRRDVLVVDDAVHFDPDAWNHVFVPLERLFVLEAAVQAIGLRIRDARVEAPGAVQDVQHLG